MSRLSTILSGLLKRAGERGVAQQTSLGKGLQVRVTTQPSRLCLWRTEGQWEPGEAAEREAHTCAKVLGWSGYTLRWQGKYLIVEAAVPLLAAGT